MSQTTDFKEGKAAVKIIYYTSKTLADGSHPFLVRISKDAKRKYISTGYSLPKQYWNPDKKNFRDAIRKGYGERARATLIVELTKLENKYNGAATEALEDDTPTTAADVAAVAASLRKAERRATLLAYLAEIVAGQMKAGKIKNASVYRDLGKQLEKFIADEYPTAGGDLPFRKINVSFCNEWENTLRATGNIDTTLSNRFRTLRAVLNKAIAEGVCKPEYYPFARTVAEKHRFQVGKFDTTTVKRAITRAEVRAVEAVEPANDAQKLAKEVFVFSFYYGGINFADVAQLRWRDLTGVDVAGGQRGSYTRQKTGGKFNMKLPAPAAAIVAEYRPLTYNGPDSYVFPILNAARHITKTQIENRRHKVLGRVNKALKVLGARVGISAAITTYVARHSMATALRESGAATAVISQMLGHRDEATTAIYLAGFSAETIDAALDGLV